jgi:hypothetical protein
MEEKALLSDQHRQFQSQIEALTSNQTSIRDKFYKTFLRCNLHVGVIIYTRRRNDLHVGVMKKFAAEAFFEQ